MTPWTVAHQAPLSMGFPRLEYWSGLPFPSAGNLPNPGKPLSIFTYLIIMLIRIRKIKNFILPSFIACLVLILSLYRSEFLTYIIFLLSEELLLTFLARQVYGQKNSLNLVLLLLLFSHSVMSVMTVLSVMSDSATSWTAAHQASLSFTISQFA